MNTLVDNYYSGTSHNYDAIVPEVDSTFQFTPVVPKSTSANFDFKSRPYLHLEKPEKNIFQNVYPLVDESSSEQENTKDYIFTDIKRITDKRITESIKLSIKAYSEVYWKLENGLTKSSATSSKFFQIIQNHLQEENCYSNQFSSYLKNLTSVEDFKDGLVVENVKSLLNELSSKLNQFTLPDPQAMPGEDSSLSLFWELNNYHFVIDVFPNNEIDWFWRNKIEDISEGDEEVSIESLLNSSFFQKFKESTISQ